MFKLKLGDCRDEELIEQLFGSVSDFARVVEELGDSFTTDTLVVEYDEDTDIHTFYSKEH
jgi:hypothetical protein